MSTELEDGTAAPAIVLVALGNAPAGLVLPANAELGRRVAAGGGIHELADERMSRDHATVQWDRGIWVITDLDSRNGTYVDGERIRGEHRARGDVVVRLGHTVFLLLADGRGHPVESAGGDVIGPELGRAYEQIRRAAGEPALLIHGEPGAGKELAARLHHACGPRAKRPFVAVNCAAMPEGVAERMLFGGVRADLPIETFGHVQMARGGTLFLDELADLDAAAQAALMKHLARSPVETDPCIIGGGHEMRTAVADRRFREDLYQRLGRVAVTLPPLRARKVDIARLVQREIAEVATRAKGTLAAHPKLIEACCLRFWPGNVRELRATVKHAATEALARGRDVVRVDDLAATAGLAGGTSSGETAVERPRNAGAVAFDKAAVTEALSRANGVVSVAARALGLHRSQLFKLMEQHGVTLDE